MGAARIDCRRKMKAAYALGFLGLCAFVLVLHVYDAPAEVAKEDEVQDPFLASLEAHVVARAQRRLRERDLKEASDNHISAARKAIKAAMLDAHSSSLHEIKKHEEEIAAARTAAKAAATKAAKTTAGKAAPTGGKVYTWAELQRGDDAKSEIFTQNKVENLVGNLRKAPQADKSMRGTAIVTSDDGDDQEADEERHSTSALSGALARAKDAVDAKDEDHEEPADKVEE